MDRQICSAQPKQPKYSIHNTEIFFFLNVNINVIINDYSFKYICVVFYLKLRLLKASFVQSPMLLVFQNKTIIKIIAF